jgi:hypothetical protein
MRMKRGLESLRRDVTKNQNCPSPAAITRARLALANAKSSRPRHFTHSYSKFTIPTVQVAQLVDSVEQPSTLMDEFILLFTTTTCTLRYAHNQVVIAAMAPRSTDLTQVPWYLQPRQARVWVLRKVFDLSQTQSDICSSEYSLLLADGCLVTYLFRIAFVHC